VQPASSKADDIALALKQLYDQYGVCAGRLVDLVDWVTSPDNNKPKKATE